MTWRIEQGDCLELMADLPAQSVDAVVTDPPYGIAYNPIGGNGVAQRGNLPRVTGDNRPFDPQPFLHFPTVVLFGADHYYTKLPDGGSWFVWYKRRDIPSINFADCEMAWCNVKHLARVFDHRWHGMIRDSEQGEKRVHPTQKPIMLMRWVMDTLKIPRGATIFDPFCGSGTTGVAAIQTGRNFIGFEISPEYCTIARKRCEAAAAQLRLDL